MKQVLSRGEIVATLQKLGRKIDNHYKAAGITEVNVVVVMSGGLFFGADLAVQLEARSPGRWKLSTVGVSSYNENRQQIIPQLHMNQVVGGQGGHFLIVDDLSDTGVTLRLLVDEYKGRFKPESIRTCVLIDKQKATVRPDFVGITASPEDWLVGYGMDDNGLYRAQMRVYALED